MNISGEVVGGLIALVLVTAIYCLYNMWTLRNCDSKTWKIVYGQIPQMWRYSVWYNRIYLVLDLILCFPYRFCYFVGYYVFMIFFICYLYLKKWLHKLKVMLGIGKKKY